MNTAPATSAPDPYVAPTFDRLIAMHENGDLNAELSDMLRETLAGLSNYVLDHGGKPEAEITVKFKFKLDGGNISAQAKIDDKQPVPPRGSSFYFLTANNQLTKRDPKQIDMFKDVNAGAKTAAISL